MPGGDILFCFIKLWVYQLVPDRSMSNKLYLLGRLLHCLCNIKSNGDGDTYTLYVGQFVKGKGFVCEIKQYMVRLRLLKCYIHALENKDYKKLL